MNYVYMALGWVASNAVALVAGGYLGYRFGDTVKEYAVKLLAPVAKVAAKVLVK